MGDVRKGFPNIVGKSDHPDDHSGELNTLMRSMGRMMTESVHSAFTAISSEDQMKQVAIYVDYDNVYHTLMNNYKHHPDHEEDAKNLFLKLWHHYGRDNVRSFRAYADYEQIRSELTSLQKKRIQIRHVYANGKTEDGRKNASDIELSIDAIEATYKDPLISCYVFVTADSDMIPVMSRLMYKGKRVELFYTATAIAKHTDIRRYAHKHYDLLEFLGVRTDWLNVERLLAPAIQCIEQWHQTYGESDRTLGQKFLSTTLVKGLDISPLSASRLIDLLKQERVIVESTKMVRDEVYPNFILNKDHPRVPISTRSQTSASGRNNNSSVG